MLKLFAVINIIIDIAVVFCLYVGHKIPKGKEKFWLLEKEQEEESIKYIKDLLLDEYKCGRYRSKYYVCCLQS